MVESQGDVVPVGAGVARHRPDRYPDGAFAGRDRRTNTNIRELHIQSHDGIFEGRVSLYVKNIQDLKVIMEKVGKIRGIEKVNRVENNQE